MSWGDQFIGLLDRAFQIEHLSTPEGKSYGAGNPIPASDVLQAAIPGEQLEYYAEILVDEWAAQQLVDQELGLETLLEFEIGGSADSPVLVQYVMLESEIGKSFLGRKIDGQSLDFLVAVDLSARESLLSASVMALLAADVAFGDPIHEIRLPNTISNSRPDIISEHYLQRGVSLMLDQVEGRGLPAWEVLADRQALNRTDAHDMLVESFFRSVYVESELW